jgi:signal transduction histidine kinase
LTGQAHAGRRPHRALAIRLASTLALLAVSLTALAGWVVHGAVGRALERATTEALERRLARVDRTVERIGGDVDGVLGRLATVLVRHESQRLVRLAAGGPEVVGDAAWLAETTDLDVLTALDARGTVLSAAHWPELAGLDEPSLAGLAAGRPAVRRVEGPLGGRLAVVVAHAVRAGDVEVTLVGGRSIGEGFAESVALGHAALVFDLDADGAGPVVVTAGRPIGPLDPWAELARGADPDGTQVIGQWLAGVRSLPDDRGQVQAVVVAAVPRAAGAPGLVWAFAVVGAVGVALAVAVGAWAARRITRPLDQLVRAVDAIAAGEADYGLPARPADELDRLAAAFSRLQRSLERQQRRSAAAERVAAWRDVARRVAHEVKNPLVPIRLTVENLKRARGRDPRLFDELFEEGARTILDEVEQLRRLVTEFSEFARLPPPRPRAVEVHELIDGVLELYAAEPELEIVRSYRGRPAVVEVDEDQIGRALKNVVGNSLEAMRGAPSAPRLEIGTQADGGMVEIEVRDNGAGMAPDVVDRVFDPYFTTKPEGTGLGLAMVFRIVTEHGGEVEAANRPEGGARIRIRLPLAAARARASEASA